MNSLALRFILVHPDAVLPRYAHGAGDAGADLFSVEEVLIPARSRRTVSTGVKIALPAFTEAQIRSRSGLAHKHGIYVLNAPGTIDPSYRGELKAILANHSDDDYLVRVGDAIAQMVVAPILQLPMVEVVDFDDLTSSTRGEAGFGSTGR